MVNAQIQTLHEPDGSPVCNVLFDVSAAQLGAAAYAVAEIKLERHRGEDLETDDVLALRDLMSVRDELDGLVELQAAATMVMPLARFIVLHDAVDEWVATRTGRDWLREADDEALPIVDAMLGPMVDLRQRALAATLGSPTRTR